MSNTVKFIGLIAMAAVLFGCEKKIDPVNDTPKDNTEQQTDLSQYDPGEYLVSFGATIENPETKAVITIGDTQATVAFEEGDKVLAVSGSESKTYVYNATESKFLPAAEPLSYSENDILFYYPASCFDAKGVFTMPDAATGLADLGDKAPMAAKIAADSASEEVEVTFKSLSSILRVQITGEKQLLSVKLEGAEASYIGAGTSFPVSWNGDIPSFGTTTTTEPSTSISIEVASSAQLSETAQDFYFLLPSGQTIENLSLTANLADNHNGGTNTFTISRSGSIDVSSPKIYTMSFYAGLFSGGTGTVQDPYKIATARDFKYISKYCAEGYTAGNKDAASFLGATYKQTADIDFKDADLSNYMIASASAPFTGTYNGGNKTLSNFTITGTPSVNEGVAPFKAIDGAVLQNISISGATVTGGKFTAGLVGYAKGAGVTIQNCAISKSTISDTGNDFGAAGLIGGIYGGTVTGCSGTDLTISTGVENKAYFGGIITYINGTVTVSGCELNGTTTVTNAQKFGGIIGQINNANATITDCHNHSTINGSKNYNGGICGYAKLGTISNCTNDGAVNGVSSTAGIVAQLDGATVNHCTNSGTIHGSQNYTAGIVAYHTKGDLANCVNEGRISADGGYVGGIAGMLKSSAAYGLIKSCRSNANLSGANDVAGIVGRVTFGVVMDCFAKGSATGGLNTGGIVGYAYSTDGNVAVINCLASVDVTCTASGNQHSGGVIGRATCVDAKYVYIGNCAGLNNVVKATESNAVRFGAFTGFTNAEKKSGSATPNRVRIWNSYTLVDDSNFQCANTGATADVGGFIGCMGAASDLGDCYYIIDGSKSTLTGSNYKNITQTTAAVIGGTGSIAVNPTRQGLNLDDTFLNVLNRCTYASNGTTRLAAFTDYPMCDWTMTGANGEALSHPVPANLVALGEDFYE